MNDPYRKTEAIAGSVLVEAAYCRWCRWRIWRANSSSSYCSHPVEHIREDDNINGACAAYGPTKLTRLLRGLRIARAPAMVTPEVLKMTRPAKSTMATTAER